MRQERSNHLCTKRHQGLANRNQTSSSPTSKQTPTSSVGGRTHTSLHARPITLRFVIANGIRVNYLHSWMWDTERNPANASRQPCCIRCHGSLEYYAYTVQSWLMELSEAYRAHSRHITWLSWCVCLPAVKRHRVRFCYGLHNMAAGLLIRLKFGPRA